MILYINGHDFHYEMENLCRVFFPDEKIKTVYEYEREEKTVETVIEKRDSDILIFVKANIDGKESQNSEALPLDTEKDELERRMAVLLFGVFEKITGYRPAWGILTGVRPSKLMNRLELDYGKDGAVDYFKNRLLVSDDKTSLALEVAHNEQPLMDLSEDNSYSLYLSIPFCPTRCSYCSFVSHSIKSPSAKKLVPEYVKLLCKELEIIGRTADELGLKLETVYYGGGTPTSLEADDLDKITETVARCFPIRDTREYTVEAGRPDTITPEKLAVLKKNGVTRISINPQTFEDKVLEAIGRKHTSEQTIEAFKMARRAGFDNINMDLIAGLPLDTAAGFYRTLSTVRELDPESVTVHTLALKRSSTLVTEGFSSGEASEVPQMLSDAQEVLTNSGYIPYYMYRQSRSLGNMENVGWCKAGYEGLYNIYMMEECHTILSAGAGAVTKLKAPRENYIERIFNFKYPYEYNSRFDELMERKDRIKTFYQSYNGISNGAK